MNKCPWALSSPAEEHYHDTEWGVPVHDDRLLFEFLILEGAQAGLSWATVLNKRAGYQQAFNHFDVQKIAQYNEQKQQALITNPEIIRQEASRILAEFGQGNGHVFNLGHGITPNITPENVAALVDAVHDISAQYHD